ncbi:MAG: DUF4388 domain-containing protein [Candidatus Eisenbacteria bacterium]|nr:DUF4388 domain-containing protein [Candidatus Eisenbacteria bacterium]
MGLRGDLGDFGAIEVLQLLAGQEKTGVLRLYQGRSRVSLVFDSGRIVSTWDRTIHFADPFKSYLLSQRVLPEHQTMKALRLEARSDLPFAEIMIREGMMDMPELSRLVQAQILREVRAILGWGQGRFEFFPDPSVRPYIPGVHVKVETLLLEAARQIDEADAGKKTPKREESRLEKLRPAALTAKTRRVMAHAALLVLLPTVSLLLSGRLFPPPAAAPSDAPLFGERVAGFHAEREVRNLRLVLEMYRALHDHYPDNLNQLVRAKLLSPRRLVMLRNLEISYRPIRGGTRYFLQSGRYGPLVRGIPAGAVTPIRPVPEPIRSGSLDPERPLRD